MNLFLDASKWEDDVGSPPIWWAGSRYEILIDNDGSAAGEFVINMTSAAVAEDTIKFSYEVSNWDPAIGYSDGYINIVDDQDNVVASVNFLDQASGEMAFECVVGRTYAVMVAYSSSDPYSGNFYDFEAILTPTPDEEPEPEPEIVKPWWLCNAKEPVTPCPVRPTNFVSLDEYDVDFKFPLLSSRVESKIVRAEECMVCRPTLIGQTDPVEPPVEECIDIEFYGGCGCIDTIHPDYISGWPSWFNEDMGFDLELETPDGTVSAYYSPSFDETPHWFNRTGGSSLYGPLTGTGTLTQENTSTYETHSVCVNYTINPGS